MKKIINYHSVPDLVILVTNYRSHSQLLLHNNDIYFSRSGTVRFTEHQHSLLANKYTIYSFHSEDDAVSVHNVQPTFPEHSLVRNIRIMASYTRGKMASHTPLRKSKILKTLVFVKCLFDHSGSSFNESLLHSAGDGKNVGRVTACPA